jgi:hypothetical protein
MIKKQYESLLKGPPYHSHPEMLTVQYILPCFVASYLELEQTDKSSQAKEEYLRFVHELVKSYEQRDFSLQFLNSKPNKAYLQHNALFLPHFKIDMEQNLLHAYSVLNVLEKITPNSHKNVTTGLRFISLFSTIKITTDLSYEITFFEEFDDSCWFDQCLMILNRIQASLDKLGKINNTTPLHHSGALGIVISKIIDCTLFDQKIEHLIMVLINRLPYSNTTIANKSWLNIKFNYHNFDCLSNQQLFNTVYFVCFNEILIPNRKYGSLIALKQCFPFDTYGKIVLCILNKDWWKLKIIVGKCSISKKGEDLSLIPLSLAKKLRCCKDLTKAISPSGKILMNKPGAITFFPIKHCRWCGLVVSDTITLCKVCKENQDYPDRNYFCSKKCETECLENQHTEEHATFLMMQLNIDV